MLISTLHHDAWRMSNKTTGWDSIHVDDALAEASYCFALCSKKEIKIIITIQNQFSYFIVFDRTQIWRRDVVVHFVSEHLRGIPSYSYSLWTQNSWLGRFADRRSIASPMVVVPELVIESFHCWSFDRFTDRRCFKDLNRMRVTIENIYKSCILLLNNCSLFHVLCLAFVSYFEWRCH